MKFIGPFALLLEACDDGLFGENCNTSCGRCLNSEPCHHINGSCAKGCESGFQGWNCTEGEYIILANSI